MSEISMVAQRLSELRGACAIPSNSREALLEQSLAELSTTVEELQVAEVELTEQNQRLVLAQTLAEEERRRYQDLFMTAPYGMVITDLRGVIQEGNHAAAALLGVDIGNAAGKPLALFVPLAQRGRFQRWAREVAASVAGTTSDDELTLRTLGREREFPCGMTVIRAAETYLSGAALRWTLVDLTERERARDRERFEAQSVRKDEFLATLGHELRNPLAAIALAAELLKRQPEQGVSKPGWAVEMIQRHAKQISRLVDDLLDVSRLVHGKVELRRQPTNLAEVVASAIESVQPTYRAKGHTLSVDQDEEPMWVDGDPARLQQVVTNVLDNAAKYSPSGGLVEVRLRRQAGEAVLSVRDFGVGISEELRDRIFNMFEQGTVTTTTGLGIGLTVVRELVRRHGGSVEARSQGPGHGSEFVVRLPLVAGEVGADHRPARITTPLPPITPGESVRILIIDDNRDAAEMLRLGLVHLGHQAFVAEDAGAAIELARGCDVALIDLGMPDVDGFEMARRLRAVRRDLRLVAVTGFGDERNRVAAARAGFDKYVLKPVEVAELDLLLRTPSLK
jgi:PAS domain S-box-containing protein